MGIEIGYLSGECSGSHLDYFTRNLVECRSDCASPRGDAVFERVSTDSPPSHVVTLATAKAHARVRHTEEDELLPLYLAAAEQQVERDTGVALVRGQFTVTVKGFPSGRGGLRLPVWPVRSVDAFSHYTRAGVLTAASSPIPYYLTAGRPQTLELLSDEYWPTDLRAADMGVITVTAGHADGTVPDDLVLAVLLLFAHAVRFREPVVAGSGITINPTPVAGYKDKIRTWVLPSA